MTILAMCSILAYNCMFYDAFIQSPFGYMFHLLYFRSHHCKSVVNWSILGVENMTSDEVPQMPIETGSTTRTFWFAIIQLVFNCLLVITSLNMLSKFFLANMKDIKKFTSQSQQDSIGCVKLDDGLIGHSSLP